MISSPRFPMLVAASVSEWFLVHSLMLAATPTRPEQALVAYGAAAGGLTPGYRTQRE